MKKIISFSQKGEQIKLEYYTKYNNFVKSSFEILIDEIDKECIIKIIEELNELNKCNIQIMDNTSGENKYFYKEKEHILIDFSCVKNVNFTKYLSILEDYSIDDQITVTHDEYGAEHAVFKTNSLEFLPELEDSINRVCDYCTEGLIFSTIDKGHYQIEVYDGYRE